MENRVKLLIAVGASITANCQPRARPPCLKTAITEAQSAGVDNKEIVEAIAIGRVVRKGASGKMDRLASTLAGKDAVNADKCPFGSTEEGVKEWVEEDKECGCK